jgi:solute carrier family 35 protein
MPESKSAAFYASTPFAVGGYMLCSATLLISNKYAIYKVAAPSFILFSQLIGTALVVKAFAAMGQIECDALEKEKLKKFLPVALIFLATIFSNMKSLQYANVETFMVFRFSTPLVVSIADYLFLGRQLPSPASWVCLFALLVGAVGYAVTDSAFQVKGYTFCAIWYCIFCLDQIYLKHITNTVKMQSNWGNVFYSNFVASLPLVFTFIGDSEEIEALKNISFSAFVAVFISVALGVGMSYFAWMARSLLSAASFTVVGNVCKVLTIAMNVALWDKHASPTGIGCLLFCLGAAYFYKQAPMRADHKDSDDVELGKTLLPK